MQTISNELGVPARYCCCSVRVSKSRGVNCPEIFIGPGVGRRQYRLPPWNRSTRSPAAIISVIAPISIGTPPTVTAPVW